MLRTAISDLKIKSWIIGSVFEGVCGIDEGDEGIDADGDGGISSIDLNVVWGMLLMLDWALFVGVDGLPGADEFLIMENELLIVCWVVIHCLVWGWIPDEEDWLLWVD